MRKNIAIALGLFAIYSPPAARCNASAALNRQQTAFLASPNPALMDDRIAIKMTGLPPNREITIGAASRDQGGCWWRSSAVFVARGDGSIDLSAMAPVLGTYAGADAMGLFWSMQPDRRAGPVPAFFAVADWFKPIETEIQAALDGRVLGTARVIRYFAAPGVRAEPFGRDGVVGILYRMGDGRKHPGVILLGGSEGGFPAPQGAMLASRGYVVLALAYFGTNGLPAAMQRIPIEYFGNAIHSMLTLPEVEGAAISIMGGSRGGEAALMVSATYPQVNGVAAASASHVRWEGATARMLPGGPAWTYEGKPLAYVPLHIGPVFAVHWLWAAVTGGPVSLRPMFVDSLGRVENHDAEIPVERIRGPVLFGSGDADREWPSGTMSQLAMDRLRRNHHPYADAHVSYEGAGHWLPCEYLPTGGLLGRMADEIGGTPAGTAAAQRQWWPRVLGFLAGIGSRHGGR
jgi:pimeloyl-ACP methyl ester carboxylesterase